MEDGAPQAKNHDVYFVPGLARGLRALEAVGAAGRPLTITEIGRELELGRSSAFRLVYTLAHMRFLEPDAEGRRYALGPRVLNLGFAWLAGQDLIRLARPELERLAQETGVAAHLAIRDARDVLYLDAAEPMSEAPDYVSNVKIGARRAAHASPMGWLLLSELSKGEIEALYGGVEMPAVTEHTPRTAEALAARAAQAGRDGHVVSRGMLARGGASLCAPVRDRAGRLAAAVDVSAPEAAFHRGSLEQAYLPAVRAAAERISARLGA
jgi:DNA-binding IclR family transcriptional regulator